MINGARPTKEDKRDYDFHRTFGTTKAPEFPLEYDTDAGLWMPDQNKPEPIFNNPALPYGCTDYTQADLSADIDGILKDPMLLEAETHANAEGGKDIRDSLLSARKLKWIDSFFNIKAYSPLDYFDAFRYAQISGGKEYRSVSWGTPWFPEWENAINGVISTKNLDGTYTLLSNPAGKQVVMPMPSEESLKAIKEDIGAFGWHNSKLCGWTMRNSVPMYRDKSWQGGNIGEGGIVLFPREVVNVVMEIRGTVGFTATQNKPDKIRTVKFSIFQWIISNLEKLLPLHY